MPDSDVMNHLKWREIAREGEELHLALVAKRRGSPKERHDHDFVEVFWVTSGRGRHEIGGEVVDVEPGDVWFVRAEDVHALDAIGGETLSFTNLAFPLTDESTLAARYRDSVKQWPWGGEAGARSFHLSSALLRRVQATAEEALHLPRTAFHRDRLLLGLLHSLEMASRRTVLPDAPDWLRRTVRQMGHPERFAEGTAALFELAGRSPEHVSREFRRYLGISPSQFVATQRMEHAAMLLQSTYRKVEEIAEACGYQSVSHFHERFMAFHGMTPLQFRKRRAVPF